MDLTGMALRAVAARPHVLLAATPGGAAARVAAESHLRRRDWPLASTPAQADVLFVAGPDCPALEAALQRLWQDMPAPRTRVRARDADEVTDALDAARGNLRLRPGRPTVRRRGSPPAGSDAHRQHDRHAPGGQDAHDGHGSGDHEGQDEHGSGEHGHGGHGGDTAEMPGGLPMAEQGEDRDGLTLDRLHVPLGPFLADWPAGLVVRMVLQGDVVQRADLEEPPPPAAAPAHPFWTRPWLRAAAGEPVSTGEAVRRRAAAHLDSLGRLLGVAGWPVEATRARRLRDDLLDGAPAAVVAPRLEPLARRVGRSRTLYRLTRGMGVVTTADAEAAGVSGPAARAGGDVPARYRQWLAAIRGDVPRLDDRSPLDPALDEGPRGRWDAERPPSAALAALLPRLLDGAELAAARLVVASLDPDPDELAACPREVRARG